MPQQRQFGLGRIERPAPKRQITIPWRRLGIASASLMVTGAMLYGAAWLVTGDTLRVREINVVGAQVEHPRAIAFASGLGGNSILLADLTGAADAITELPGIKAAHVSRAWPNGVRIEVEEHQAWGYWQVANQVLEIDADGHVLQHARPAPENAPTIIELSGPPSPNDENGTLVDADTVRLVARLLADGALQDAGIDPVGFVFRRDRGLIVLMENAPSAVFGDSSNYEFKVQAWQGLIQQIRMQDIDAQEIDLRFGRNVVLR